MDVRCLERSIKRSRSPSPEIIRAKHPFDQDSSRTIDERNLEALGPCLKELKRLGVKLGDFVNFIGNLDGTGKVELARRFKTISKKLKPRDILDRRKTNGYCEPFYHLPKIFDTVLFPAQVCPDWADELIPMTTTRNSRQFIVGDCTIGLDYKPHRGVCLIKLSCLKEFDVTAYRCTQTIYDKFVSACYYLEQYDCTIVDPERATTKISHCTDWENFFGSISNGCKICVARGEKIVGNVGELLILAQIGQEFYDLITEAISKANCKKGICLSNVFKSTSGVQVGLRCWAYKRLITDISFILVNAGLSPLKGTPRNVKPRKEIVAKLRSLKRVFHRRDEYKYVFERDHFMNNVPVSEKKEAEKVLTVMDKLKECEEIDTEKTKGKNVGVIKSIKGQVVRSIDRSCLKQITLDQDYPALCGLSVPVKDDISRVYRYRDTLLKGEYSLWYDKPREFVLKEHYKMTKGEEDYGFLKGVINKIGKVATNLKASTALASKELTKVKTKLKKESKNMTLAGDDSLITSLKVDVKEKEINYFLTKNKFEVLSKIKENFQEKSDKLSRFSTPYLTKPVIDLVNALDKIKKERKKIKAMKSKIETGEIVKSKGLFIEYKLQGKSKKEKIEEKKKRNILALSTSNQSASSSGSRKKTKSKTGGKSKKRQKNPGKKLRSKLSSLCKNLDKDEVELVIRSNRLAADSRNKMISRDYVNNMKMPNYMVIPSLGRLKFFINYSCKKFPISDEPKPFSSALEMTDGLLDEDASLKTLVEKLLADRSLNEEAFFSHISHFSQKLITARMRRLEIVES